MLLKDILEKTGISQQRIGVALGIPRDRISKWIQGKGNPKVDDQIILDAFYKEIKGKSSQDIIELVARRVSAKEQPMQHPHTEILSDDPNLDQLNPQLITKESKTFGKDIDDFQPKTTGKDLRDQKAFQERGNKKIPMLGEAAASTDMQLDVPVTHVDQYIDVGDLLRDSEAAFTVYGSSMVPSYPSGAVLGLKRNYDGFIMPGECYVLVTASNRVFKRLYLDDNDPDVYICYSDNTMVFETGPRKGNYAYPPFPVKKNDVISLYDVVGMIKRNRNSSIQHRIYND